MRFMEIFWVSFSYYIICKGTHHISTNADKFSFYRIWDQRENWYIDKFTICIFSILNACEYFKHMLSLLAAVQIGKIMLQLI